MKVPFHGLDPHSCVAHYCSNQSGGGIYPAFAGARYQQGHGLGSMLGGLFRSAVPIFKRGLAGVGKYALRSGAKFVDDVAGGKSFKEAAQGRLIAAKNDALSKLRDEMSSAGEQTGTGKRKRKRKCCTKPQPGKGKRQKKRQKKRSKADFFG
jgi:hypothetical protein